MPAPTHTRPHPTAARGVDVRLPWWAVALPMAAFVVLLLLIAGPGEAHAADGDPAIGRILEQIQRTLSR